MHWNASHNFLFVGLFVFTALTTGSPAGADEIPPELSDVPESWLKYQWGEVKEKRDLLIEAYSIPADDLSAFLHLYYGAWRAYREHHVSFARNTSIDDDPKVAKKKLYEFAENSPVSPFALMALVESMLPPGDYTTQRARFSELTQRATAMRYKASDSQGQQDQLIRDLFRFREGATSPRDVSNRPLPLGVALAMTKGMLPGEIPLGEVIPSPETVVPLGPAGRTVDRSLFNRPRLSKKPVVLSINDEKTLKRLAAAANAELPKMGVVETVTLIDPLEDDFIRQVNRMIDSAQARAKSPDEKQELSRLRDEILYRANIQRRLNEDEYRKLDTLTSRSEFSRALAKLDAVLHGLMMELQLRVAVVD